MPPDDGNAANIGNQAIAVGGNLFAQQGHHHLADEIRGLLRLLGWRDASGGLGWDGFFCARQSPSRAELYAAGACCGCAAHQHDVTDQTAVALCGPVEIMVEQLPTQCRFSKEAYRRQIPPALT